MLLPFHLTGREGGLREPRARLVKRISAAFTTCKVYVRTRRVLVMPFAPLGLSVSQKIWLNLDHFRNCREFNSVWRISLAFAN